jgi:hypothetical protein
MDIVARENNLPCQESNPAHKATSSPQFYILLTVHPEEIVGFNQLDAPCSLFSAIHKFYQPERF